MDDPARSASAGGGRADLLIEGAYVVTLDPRRPVVVDGSVAVVGETVAAVGPASEVAAAFPRAAERIDASGCLVMPGLIDTHTHLFRSWAVGWATGWS